MTPSARRVGLLLALGGLLVVLDTVVAVVALPRIVADLDTTLAVAQWVTTGYLLGIVAVIPAAGWLAGRFGDRRVYLCALAVFTAASVAAGLAPDIELLVASRVLQGLGGGLLNPVGQVIGLRTVPRSQVGAMMALLGLPVLLGPVAGMPIAGWLVDSASWRWVFLVNLPLGLLAMAVCRVVVPPAPDDRAQPGRLDVLGLALLPTGAVLLVLGVTVVGERGTLSPAAGGALVAGTVLLGVVVRRAWRQPAPLVDVRLLARGSFASGVALLACFGAGYFGSQQLTAVLVQGVHGRSASLGAVVGLPQALATGLVLLLATRLVDRLEPRLVVRVGLTLALVGTGSTLVAVALDAPLAVVAALGVVVGAGSGATIMPTMAATLRALDPDAAGAGTTLLALVQQIASAVGIAVVVGVLSVALSVEVPELAADGDRGGLGAVLALGARDLAELRDALSTSMALAYLPGLLLTAVALLLARRLAPVRAPASSSATPHRAR